MGLGLVAAVAVEEEVAVNGTVIGLPLGTSAANHAVNHGVEIFWDSKSNSVVRGAYMRLGQMQCVWNFGVVAFTLCWIYRDVHLLFGKGAVRQALGYHCRHCEEGCLLSPMPLRAPPTVLGIPRTGFTCKVPATEIRKLE